MNTPLISEDRITVVVPRTLRDSQFALMAKAHSWSEWYQGDGTLVVTIDPELIREACDDIDCCMGGPHTHVSRKN